jgi:ABC-type polysaccharide/polyol phosphate export permease
MQLILNQYSFVIIGLFVLLTLIFFTWRLVGIKYAIPIGVVMLVVLVGFQLIFSTASTEYQNIESFNKSLNSDKPTLLFLYSDF